LGTTDYPKLDSHWEQMGMTSRGTGLTKLEDRIYERISFATKLHEYIATYLLEQA